MYHETTILGNVGRDPDTKFLPSGTQITNVSVAVNESWTDKTTGERKEETTWYKLSFFGKSAENAANLITKGAVLFAIGTVKANAYTGKDGEVKASLEMRVNTWKIVSGRAEKASDYEEYAPPPREIDEIPF